MIASNTTKPVQCRSDHCFLECRDLLRKFDPSHAIATFGFVMEGEFSSVSAAFHFPLVDPRVTSKASVTAREKREQTIKSMRNTCLVGADLVITEPVPKREPGETMGDFHERTNTWKRVHGSRAVVSVSVPVLMLCLLCTGHCTL